MGKTKSNYVYPHIQSQQELARSRTTAHHAPLEEQVPAGILPAVALARLQMGDALLAGLLLHLLAGRTRSAIRQCPLCPILLWVWALLYKLH